MNIILSYKIRDFSFRVRPDCERNVGMFNFFFNEVLSLQQLLLYANEEIITRERFLPNIHILLTNCQTFLSIIPTSQ